VSSGSAVRTEPYVGPRAFERGESDRFFGRPREAYEVSSLVLANKFFLLYAASGAGKTSLVNAGVLPLVENRLDVLPTARFQSPPPGGTAEIANVYTHAVLSGWSDSADPAELGGTTLTEFLARPRPPGARLRPRLLVFDQFEELFTAHPERWPDRRAFLEQLAQASQEHTDLRVLIVLREDFLARMLEHAGLFQGGLRDRYFLEPLRRPAAELAITSPLRGTGRAFSPAALADLVTRLMTSRVNLGDSRIVQVEGEFVEPVLLQVVCSAMWDKLEATQIFTITPVEVRKLADVDDSLGRFYADAVRDAARQSAYPEQKIRTWVQDKLITHGGTRGTAYAGDREADGLPIEVATLLEGRFLRAERRAGGRWLEITHDSLLTPIEQSNTDYFARIASAAQGRRWRSLTWRRRPFRRWLVVMGVAAVVALVALGLTLGQDIPSEVSSGIITLVTLTGFALIVIDTRSRKPKAADDPLDDIADDLANVIRQEWEHEVRARGLDLLDPLGVLWVPAENRFGGWASITRMARSTLPVSSGQRPEPESWAEGLSALAGAGDIRRTLSQVPTGRLVIIGEPGSGKTVLLIRLVLSLLDHRLPGEAVPVLLSLGSWDPWQAGLREWVLDRLMSHYPALRTLAVRAGPGTTEAHALLDGRKLLLVLDGLDEVLPESRLLAIEQINDALHGWEGLVLTCRTAEYVQASADVVIQGAVGIELRPLNPVQIADYIRRYAGGTRVPARWEPVLQVLGTDDPLARVLDSPLNVSLAVAIYNPRVGDPPDGVPNPAELLDRRRFPGAEQIEEHLSAGLIRTAYRRGPVGQLPWAAADAERWLTFLARMNGSGHDLGWWELRKAVPRLLVPLAVALVCGLVAGVAAVAGRRAGTGIGIGLGTGIVAGLGCGLPLRRLIGDRVARPGGTVTRGLAGGLAGGLIGGLGAGLAGYYVVGHAATIISALPVGLGVGLAMAACRFAGGLVGGVVGGFVAGLLEGVGTGLPAGLINGLGVALAAALIVAFGVRNGPATRFRWDYAGLVGGLAVGVGAGVIVTHTQGSFAGLVAGIVVALGSSWLLGLTAAAADLRGVPSPQAALARDIRAFWKTAPLVGLTTAVLALVGAGLDGIYQTGATLTWSVLLWDGLGIGIAAGLIVGLLFGCCQSASPSYLISHAWLTLRKELPWRLMGFLGDAHLRGVLRATGAYYQFRHLMLQRYLAEVVRTGEETPPASGKAG
jgi:NACHT domain